MTTRMTTHKTEPRKMAAQKQRETKAKKSNPNLIEYLLDQRGHYALTRQEAQTLLKNRRKDKVLLRSPMPKEIAQDDFWRFVWPFYTPEDENDLKNYTKNYRGNAPDMISELEPFWQAVWPYYTPEIEAQLFSAKQETQLFSETPPKKRKRHRRKECLSETLDCQKGPLDDCKKCQEALNCKKCQKHRMKEADAGKADDRSSSTGSYSLYSESIEEGTLRFNAESSVSNGSEYSYDYEYEQQVNKEKTELGEIG